MSHRVLLASVLLLIASNGLSRAQANDDFYAGKTVRIIIGTTTAGEYGAYAQLMAQHIGRFVPGRPTVIVQTMLGGAGLVALNHLAKVAPQDGTVLSLPHANIVQDGLLNPRVQYDPAQFQWIGRMASVRQVGVASHQSKARTLEDAKQRELIAGASGVTNPTGLNPRLLNAMAGTRFKIVSGYKGTAEARIAWERGEVDVVTTSWDGIVDRYSDQLRAGLIHPLYIFGMTRPPELAGIPSITEFGRDDTEKAFLQIYTIGAEIGRAFAFPPGVPEHRVTLWRTAFMRMLDDPDFRQSLAKGNIRVDPLAGVTLAASVAKVVGLPKETISRAGTFYERLLAEVR
jgi:tripartite-type tricarboxylate transporter receptor subunit TctC